MADADWNTIDFFEIATVADVTACLDAGADPNARDQLGYTPLHFAAAFNSDPAVVKTLIKPEQSCRHRITNGGPLRYTGELGPIKIHLS